MLPFVPFAARDAALLVATLGVVTLDASLADRGAWGVAVGVLAGLLVPYVGFLVQEWGHLPGTLHWV